MIRTIAILVLLAATAAHAQLTTTVKRIRLEHATAAELAGTTLDLGHTVFNEENLADLRIGDGATPGGIRVGSDWWTNNMLTAWGGLSRIDIEALLALSIGNFQEKDAAALSAVAAVSGRVDTVEGWGDHAEAGYLTGFTETDGVFTASAAYGITSGAISNWNAAALCFVPNVPGLAKLREIWDLQGTVFVAEVATNEVIVNVPIVNGEQAVMVKGARYYATATNYFLRPDGGTNAIYFDAASNMVIAVDGSPALTISPAGDVGVGTTPSASFSLRTDASFYAGGGVRAGSGLASLNGKIYVNNLLNSYIELVGTNLMFTATNGITGRIQMIYE